MYNSRIFKDDMNCKLKPKAKAPIATNDIALVNPGILRPKQKQHLFDNVLDAVNVSYTNNDSRVIIDPAPTGSGKSFVLVNALIPALIQQNPNTEVIMFTSPDSGCVSAPCNKFKSLWHNKVIVNHAGTRVRIRVQNSDEFVNHLNGVVDDFVSAEPTVEVVFMTTQMLGRRYSDYLDPTSIATNSYNLLPPTLVIVDEIHYGMGTVSWETILADQGRNNKNYKPHWLPILMKLAEHGSRVIGFTGTPTNSQRMLTYQGKQVFNTLDEMPKDKDTTAFVGGWTLPTPQLVYQHSKDGISEDLVLLKSMMHKIDSDTWTKAKSIGITPIMPGAFFKFGRAGSTNGVIKNDKTFQNWAKSVGADSSISTCHHKEYQWVCGSNEFYKHSVDIINEANNPVNFSVPVFMAVINSGNMGWDIPRLKYICALTHPSGKEVTNMQEQLLARANRLPFENMHSHVTTANEIAGLDVTVEQKKALAEYVVFMCSTIVYFSRNSNLMIKAFEKFRKNTHTPEEGKKIYMDAIDNFVPKNNVTPFKTPGYHMGYNAGSLNQTYKKHFCEACTAAGSIDSATGKTLCEVSARQVREFERGHAFSDAEWDDTWFHTIVLDHKNGVRTDYSPSNLFTRCPTNNGVKTYDSKDYLGKYDSNGNKVVNS